MLFDTGQRELALREVSVCLRAKDSELAGLAWLLQAEAYLRLGSTLMARQSLVVAESKGIGVDDQERYAEVAAECATLDSPEGDRFRPDPGHRTLFTTRVLVVCPNCHAPGLVAAGKFTCLACGWRLVGEPRHEVERSDPPRFLGLELLLKVSTRHGWLWAYNEEHLAQLNALVGAKLREDTPGMSSNSSWANRLPSWIVAAKNRNEILKALAKIAMLRPEKQLN